MPAMNQSSFASIDVSFDEQLHLIEQDGGLNAIHQNIRSGKLTRQQWNHIVRICTRNKNIQKLVISRGLSLSDAPAHRWWDRFQSQEQRYQNQPKISGQRNGGDISRILSKNEALQYVTLEHMHIGNSGALMIGRRSGGLVRCSKLRVLRLCNANVGDDGAIGIVNSLLHGNVPIEDLSLRANCIGDDGAAAIASLLGPRDHGCHKSLWSFNKWSRLTNLKYLNLFDNRIKERGSAAIARRLKFNKSLICIDLSHNFIGDGGTSAIADAIAHNTTLKRLYVDKCGIGREGFQSVVTALYFNTSLTLLSFKANDIGILFHESTSDPEMDQETQISNPDVEGMLLDMLEHNHSLTSLIYKNFDFTVTLNEMENTVHHLLSLNKQGLPLVHTLLEGMLPSLFPQALTQIQKRWPLNTMFEALKGRVEIFESFK